MAIRKVGFQTTYYTDKPDPVVPEKSVYERKPPKKRPKGRWLHLSSMSCRDFSKDTFDYKDLSFKLSDQGRTYQLSRCNLPTSKKQFKQFNFKPPKLHFETRSVNLPMRQSSWASLTHHSIK